SLSVAAQQAQKEVHVYRDGNSWVEETTGSIAAGRGLSLTSAIGSVHIQGAQQQNVTFTIKKRISRPAEELARKDMENFPISIVHHADAVIIEADWPRQRSGRLNAEFYI